MPAVLRKLCCNASSALVIHPLPTMPPVMTRRSSCLLLPANQPSASLISTVSASCLLAVMRRLYIELHILQSLPATGLRQARVVLQQPPQPPAARLSGPQPEVEVQRNSS